MIQRDNKDTEVKIEAIQNANQQIKDKNHKYEIAMDRLTNELYGISGKGQSV